MLKSLLLVCNTIKLGIRPVHGLRQDYESIALSLLIEDI